MKMRTFLLRSVLLLPLVLAFFALPLHAAPGSGQVETLIGRAKAAMLADPQITLRDAAAAERAAALLPPGQRKMPLAESRWLQGEAYIRLGDLKHARPRIDEAMSTIGNAAPSKLLGDILLARGRYHSMTADVAASLDDYQRAHNIFRDIGETRSRAIALLSIAQLYQEAKDYGNALKYYEQASGVYRGDPQLLLTIYNNRGNVLKEIGRYTEAEAQFGNALEIARGMKSSALVARVLSNIARSQVQAGNIDGAERTIAQGLAIAKGDAASAGPQFWGIAAQAAVKRGRYEQARTLIERDFAGSDPDEKSIAAREGHETAYVIYGKLGDSQRALRHLEALKKFDDQTSMLAASANTALAAARFDFANQELKIATLQRDEAKRTIEFQRARARTQQLIFAAAGLATIVIVAMLGFGLVTIRRSRNEVRDANIDLAATNTALSKALAAKTEFLATTSHEIRTPLNGILGMTQVMLADPKLDSATRDRVDVVHGAGVTMRALVDDILDVAKMETGHLTIEAVPFDLKATLTDLCRLWSEQASGKGLTFTLDTDACLGFIVGDAARLRQIVFNLLSNAVKFTATGGVTLSAAEREATSGPLLVITVTDTGIGIAPDKHELIFESFRQADGGTTRQFGGTGLGLAICRNLAHAMEGTVTVASEEGAGAVFTLTVPLIRAEAPAEMAAADADEPAIQTLLIVDRNPISRAMLRTVLEPRAGAVALATSAEEAEAALAAGNVALMLVDDGVAKGADDPSAALAALAAAAHRAGSRTALLAAAIDDAARAELTAAGFDAVIAKPIAGPALADALYGINIGSGVATNLLVSRAA